MKSVENHSSIEAFLHGTCSLNKTVTEKEKREEPADKGIPVQLKPDKLLANEEFYEQLRDSMREVKATQDFEATQVYKLRHPLCFISHLLM